MLFLPAHRHATKHIGNERDWTDISHRFSRAKKYAVSTATSNYQICPMPELFHQKRLHFLMFFKHSNSFFWVETTNLAWLPEPCWDDVSTCAFHTPPQTMYQTNPPAEAWQFSSEGYGQICQTGTASVGREGFSNGTGTAMLCTVCRSTQNHPNEPLRLPKPWNPCFPVLEPRVSSLKSCWFPNLGTNASQSWYHRFPVWRTAGSQSWNHGFPVLGTNGSQTLEPILPNFGTWGSQF